MKGKRLLSPATESLLINTAVFASKRLRDLHLDRDAISARYAGTSKRLHRPSTRALATTAAGSAAAVGVYALVRYAMHHRDHDEDHYEASAVPEYRLVRLHDLRHDDDVLAEIQAGLLAEWGPFAPQDIDAMRAMANRAGRLVFVLGKEDEEGRFRPSAVLQTARADTGGDPARLVESYPMFGTITRHGAWTSMARRGDTAVLLQITAIGERSQGAGSLLRDAALHALPPEVKFALTTTPVDEFALDALPESYPPQVKFHYRGGARPAGFREGYKIAPADAPAGGRQRHPNVVFMRYERLEDGSWQGVRKPDLQLTRLPRRSIVGAWLRRRKAAPQPEVVIEPPETGAVAPA